MQGQDFRKIKTNTLHPLLVMHRTMTSEHGHLFRPLHSVVPASSPLSGGLVVAWHRWFQLWRRQFCGAAADEGTRHLREHGCLCSTQGWTSTVLWHNMSWGGHVFCLNSYDCLCLSQPQPGFFISPFSHFLKADGTVTAWGNAEAGWEVWYDLLSSCRESNRDVKKERIGRCLPNIPDPDLMYWCHNACAAGRWRYTTRYSATIARRSKASVHH